MNYITPIFLLLSYFLFFKMKTLNKQSNKNTQHKISVVIPARNEEINLSVILSKLQSQTIKPYEIIVVDDGSTDKTQEIANSFHVKIIKIKNPPDGWKGKNYACYTGAKESTGDLLLFLDADLILKNDAIERLLATFKEDSVLSVQPYHFTSKLYEQLSLFFNLIMLAGVGICLPGKDKSIGLFGPVIMMKRSLYFESGGHELVKNEVIEDFQLGNKLRKKGIKCDMYLGFDSISFQMYKGGITDLIWGWSKNFASGAVKTPIVNLVLVVLYIASYYSVAINLIQNIVWIFEGLTDYKLIIFNLIIYLIASYILYIKAREIGKFSLLTCIFYVMPLAAFTLIFAWSLILKFIVRRVKWKGRWHKI